MSGRERSGENQDLRPCRFCGVGVAYEKVSEEAPRYRWLDTSGGSACSWKNGHDPVVTVNDRLAIDYEAMTRPEWAFAERVIEHGARDLTDEDVAALAAEVLRLRDHAMLQDELWRSHDGYDLLTDLEPRIRTLFIGLNAEGRGEPVDMEGEEVTPERKWNNLVATVATATVHWLANARWAVIENRNAEAMRVALREIAEYGGGDGGDWVECCNIARQALDANLPGEKPTKDNTPVTEVPQSGSIGEVS